ncbi:hypothetical protein ALC53_12371 [Atta colombica]|uniref:Uncharacterized protein n=1 Tax=Atta colombica TaxID=520822 RepID=A0A151HZ43_9HYME|nr:hypothetical protein ALC53_12371 [Atta colombica]
MTLDVKITVLEALKPLTTRSFINSGLTISIEKSERGYGGPKPVIAKCCCPLKKWILTIQQYPLFCSAPDGNKSLKSYENMRLQPIRFDKTLISSVFRQPLVGSSRSFLKNPAQNHRILALDFYDFSHAYRLKCVSSLTSHVKGNHKNQTPQRNKTSMINVHWNIRKRTGLEGSDHHCKHRDKLRGQLNKRTGTEGGVSQDKDSGAATPSPHKDEDNFHLSETQAEILGLHAE